MRCWYSCAVRDYSATQYAQCSAQQCLAGRVTLSGEHAGLIGAGAVALSQRDGMGTKLGAL